MVRSHSDSRSPSYGRRADQLQSRTHHAGTPTGSRVAFGQRALQLAGGGNLGRARRGRHAWRFSCAIRSAGACGAGAERFRTAAGDRGDGDPSRREPQQGPAQRHGADPGSDRPAWHQRLPGRRALHAGCEHRQFRHEQHLDSRHRLHRRRGHDRNLHRRHTDPDPRPCLQPRRGTAEVLRHRTRRSAARSAGHAVRCRFRRRNRSLHHDAAQPLEDHRVRAQRGVVHAGRLAEL